MVTSEQEKREEGDDIIAKRIRDQIQKNSRSDSKL